jgi:hypothetical protein
MAKKKVKSSGLLRSLPKFSKKQMALLVLLFAAVGGFFVYRSFADTAWAQYQETASGIYHACGSKVQHTALNSSGKSTTWNAWKSTACSNGGKVWYGPYITLPGGYQYVYCFVLNNSSTAKITVEATKDKGASYIAYAPTSYSFDAEVTGGKGGGNANPVTWQENGGTNKWWKACGSFDLATTVKNVEFRAKVNSGTFYVDSVVVYRYPL